MAGLMSSAGLRDDSGYIDYWNRRSQAPLRYLTSFQAGQPPSDIQGKPVVGVQPEGVGVDRSFRYTRVETSPAEHRLQTPLFGTAPFRAEGDGVLVYTDVSTKLQLGNRTDRRTRDVIAERNFSAMRRDFVLAEPKVETIRVGVNTRAPPVYGTYASARR